MNEEKIQLRKDVKVLSSELEQKAFIHDVKIKSGTNNAYSNTVRQATMLLQSEAEVSAANVDNVVSIVAKYIFDFDIKESLPSKQTC